MDIGNGGLEECAGWLWLLEVAGEVLRKLLSTLSCQHPQQMPVLPGDHRHDHSSADRQHPLRGCVWEGIKAKGTCVPLRWT